MPCVLAIILRERRLRILLWLTHAVKKLEQAVNGASTLQGERFFLESKQCPAPHETMSTTLPPIERWSRGCGNGGIGPPNHGERYR